MRRSKTIQASELKGLCGVMDEVPAQGADHKPRHALKKRQQAKAPEQHVGARSQALDKPGGLLRSCHLLPIDYLKVIQSLCKARYMHLLCLSEVGVSKQKHFKKKNLMREAGAKTAKHCALSPYGWLLSVCQFEEGEKGLGSRAN